MSSSPSNAEVVASDLGHVFHSWSAQAKLAPLALEGGLGSTVWDHEGNHYLDFSSQLVNVNIGHQHPKVVDAIVRQAQLLATVAPATANLTRATAAERILSKAPAGFNKVFFTNGGADANENAIRMARLHTKRDKVVSFYRSYHGNTGAAIVATGDWRRQPNEYATGHVHCFGPYLYRSEFWAETPEQEAERALHHLERVVQAEGPGTIAAFLIESVPGTAGILVPPPGYLEGVRAIADKYGIMLILDEVMAGFARFGKWFAFESFNVVPDLITFAKGVNSGYVPVGGVIISEKIAADFDEVVFPGGLTYSGHPLAAASIVASIDAMTEERIVENAFEMGESVFRPTLESFVDAHAHVGEIRGQGVFWAVELVEDKTSRTPLAAEKMAAFKAEVLGRGVVPFLADNRLHVVPPAVITADEAKTGLAAINEALATIR